MAGLGAAHLAASHYSVMIKDKSAVFVAGPPVVARTGENLSKNELGGAERIKRQKDGGRYTIRERVGLMADPGTFHETGKIGGMAEYDKNNDLKKLTPSNFVFGKAKVSGRPVIIGGDDFTVRGGSADATIK